MAGLFRRMFGAKETPPPFCCAVVAAAGSAARMGGIDKILAPLDGTPVIVHTLRALDQCPLIREIVVVTRSDLIVPIGDLCKAYGLYKANKVVVGGATRTESVLLGALEVSPDAELIAIHDGARPLVTTEVIERVILRAAESHAAAPAVPVSDTLKRASAGLVVETPDRAQLFAVQTPQVFEASVIKAALQKAVEDGVSLTDDCAAVERLGLSVALTEGSAFNIKITTPADLAAAAGLLAWREADA